MELGREIIRLLTAEGLIRSDAKHLKWTDSEVLQLLASSIKGQRERIEKAKVVYRDLKEKLDKIEEPQSAWSFARGLPSREDFDFQGFKKNLIAADNAMLKARKEVDK